MITLKHGDTAPLFTAIDQHGKEISLNSLKGKKVVLYFYPKDNTPGCTVEACNLRDNYTDLMNNGYIIIGVSPDALTSHVKFAEKFDLPFVHLFFFHRNSLCFSLHNHNILIFK